MSWNLNLDELATAMKAQIHQKKTTQFSGVSTDSRKDLNGKVFFALKGERFDAHDFLEQAVQNGAAALVVHRSEKIPEGVTVLKVEDTLKALQNLARFWRHKMKAKVIGLTGTNGKTTTKDFAFTLISSKYRTVCTQGNLNNFIGLPLSLLQMDSETQVGIFEMGLSVPGEMEVLTQIADPDVVLVTSVGLGHLEGLGSEEEVAKNKGHIYDFAPKSAVGIFNLDNPWTKKMKEKFKGTALTFSHSEPTASISLREKIMKLEYLEVAGHISGEHGEARIPIFGRHNLSNLMAASALALAVGVESDLIWKSLPKCRGYWGRNQMINLRSGSKALFDGYNANPDSFEALLQNISRVKAPGHLIAFFGDMLELGVKSPELHFELGKKTAKVGFHHVFYVGKERESFERGLKAGGFSKNITTSVSYEDSLAQKVRNMLNPDDILIVKGSRGMKLERVVLGLDPLDFSGATKS